MRRLLLLTFAVVAGLVPVAVAALPSRSTSFEAHDHRTRGDNWHVQADIAKRSRSLIETLVLYAQRCKATVAETSVPIAADGTLVRSGTYTPTRRKAKPNSGTWSIDARFTSRRRLAGTFHLSEPGCDAGPKSFVATAGRDGHDHDHGEGRHGAHAPYPELSRATRRQRVQARKLWNASRASARNRYPTYRAARSRGFIRFARKWRRPLAFHLRSRAFDADRHILDPRRPESLVYWWPRRGKPVLVAFMYRAPAGPVPKYARNVLIWHQHRNARGRPGRTQMTHVWLVHGVPERERYANCMPVDALERSVPGFRYDRMGVYPEHDSQPCPDQRAVARERAEARRRRDAGA